MQIPVINTYGEIFPVDGKVVYFTHFVDVKTSDLFSLKLISCSRQQTEFCQRTAIFFYTKVNNFVEDLCPKTTIFLSSKFGQNKEFQSNQNLPWLFCI